LEINTRLQVEHPVTELTTGLDLVALQLKIAEGGALPFTQEEVVLKGHAIEARVYAEDANNDFLPCTGTLYDWHLTQHAGIRVDTGVERGSEVSVHYDPMLAKVIAYGADREEATRRLRSCLESASILGVTTNRRFLCRVLDSTPWAEGDLHTHFIEEHASLLADTIPPERLKHAAIAASTHYVMQRDKERSILPHVQYAWRNNPFRDERYDWLSAEGEEAMRVFIGKNGPNTWRCTLEGEAHEVVVLRDSPGALKLAIDGHVRPFRIVTEGDSLWLHDGEFDFSLSAVPLFPAAGDADAEDGCSAPMPGKVLSIRIAVGDEVEEGAPLVVLEAMKMEHTLCAGQAGTVSEVFIAEGDQVRGGELLVALEPLA